MFVGLGTNAFRGREDGFGAAETARVRKESGRWSEGGRGWVEKGIGREVEWGWRM